MMALKWGGMQIVRRLKKPKGGNRKAESINHARVERLAECDWRSDPWSSIVIRRRGTGSAIPLETKVLLRKLLLIQSGI